MTMDSEGAEFDIADLEGVELEHDEQGGDAPEMSEEAARKAGWVPKEEWNGAEERWTDWRTFIERGESDVKILRDNNRRLTRRLRNTEKKMERMQTDIAVTRDFVSKSEERGYQRALNELKAKQRAAVEQGDTETFDAIDKEITKLDTDMKAASKPAPVSAVSQEQFMSEFAEWRLDNEWYDGNPALRQWMEAKANAEKFNPEGDESPTEYFERLAEMAKKRKPAEFAKHGKEEPARRGSAVEGVTRGRPKASGYTAADLNHDARALGNSMVRMGLFKDLNEYAKSLAPDA